MKFNCSQNGHFLCFRAQFPQFSPSKNNFFVRQLTNYEKLESPKMTVPIVQCNTVFTSSILLQVGGVHIKPSKPLPATLQQFLDQSTDGAVLVSFGSGTINRWRTQALFLLFALKLFAIFKKALHASGLLSER